MLPTLTAAPRPGRDVTSGKHPALAQVIAARSSLLIIAAPIGTAFGGPIVAALGARGTLLASALATILLGLITTALLVARRRTKAAAGA